MISVIKRLAKKLIKHTSSFLSPKELRRWYEDGGDFKLRFNYPLNKNSIVFDLGGFKGDFASDLYARMPCEIYIFEPVKEYQLTIKNRFKLNKMIKVFPFGLSSKTESTYIDTNGASSSVFDNNPNNKGIKSREKIKLVNIVDFINEQNIFEIDLMKINIEGGEYDVLSKLLDENKVINIKYLQIQFHDLDKNSFQKKENIRNKLRETHNCEYCYEFIWENWIRKD